MTIDAVRYEVKAEEALYVGKGARAVRFSSTDPSRPAKLYFNSAPAHAAYPHRRITIAEASPETLGDARTANRRTIYSTSCQRRARDLPARHGHDQAAEGSLWNTMPCHTHDRRMEVYFYFALPPDGVVFHMMGQPQETRHIVVQNEQAVISPSWSIHSGVGTHSYTFIWGMVGENQVFPDMDHLKPSEMR